jgi:hypothetical protein
MKRIILSAFLVVLLLIPSLAQKPNSLTDNDKAQVVKIILENYNFIKDSADWENKKINSIYLFAENISREKVPSIKGIKFVFVTRKEIEELDKTVPDYYEFGEFQVKGKSIRISFSRLYLHPVNGDGTVTWYECRKVAGKWKVKELHTMEFADNLPLQRIK